MISSKRPIVVYIEQARIPDETTSITRSEVPITGDIVVHHRIQNGANNKAMGDGFLKELTKDALGLAIYNYMMDNSVVSEIPQNLIDDQRDTYRKEIEASAENMGKTMDEYLETTDYDTEDALLDSYNDRIEESVKAYLIFQAVAEAEKIKVTDADVSDYFGDDSLSVQQAQKYYGEEYVNQTVLYNKVGDWLTAHATIV